MSDTEDDTMEITLPQAFAEIRRLRDRVRQLEAELALVCGAMTRPDATETQPQFTHNVPPSAPPHTEESQNAQPSG
jgi:hypothetical protein